MKRKPDPSQVDSSFSMFFLLAAIGLSFVLFNRTDGLHVQPALVVLAFALLTYVTWDLIKQLYDPGQAIFLYALVFIIAPTTVTLIAGWNIGFLGMFIWMGATMFAGLGELLYEKLVKRRLPKRLLRRMIQVDGSIDSSMLALHNRHLLLTQYRGLAFGFGITLAYLWLSYLLLR